VGGAGSDTLNGGLGNDVLDGGAGADFFVFNTTLGSGNIDRIAAFNVVDDTIYLAQSIFNAFGGYGAITAGAFNTTSAALEADDRIIFNRSTGDLFYDADGSGRIAAVQFAALANVTGTLTGKDFVVI
jgi:cysteinyl-tRNA synthetase